MPSIEKHIVTGIDKSIRLSDYTQGIFISIPTRKGMKKAIDKGWVLFDGKRAKTGDWLKEGVEPVLTIPDSNKKVYEFSLQVIYEDDFLAVVHKPPGILTSGNKFHTLENALPYNLKPSLQKDKLPFPMPCHRLDYPTSGLILVGKTYSAIKKLKESFENKTIQKVYYAVTYGEMVQKKGKIDLPIDEKESVSNFEVMETVISEKYQFLNLVKLSPITGRRHQLRIHMAQSGTPILGDSMYGKPDFFTKGQGLYLFAKELDFNHPMSGKTIHLDRELPKKFTRIFSK